MDARPPEHEPSLRQGDVLLFHGHGFVSWAIRRFDESDVDRAAIVLRPETMAEATASGLRHVAIRPAIDSSAFTYVRRLAEDVVPSSVAEQASAFTTDLPPTNDPTVLLAVLAMTRKLPVDEPTLRRLLCVLLDHAAGVVDRIRARRRALLFSSEFVYRSFERARDPRAMIEVRPAPAALEGPSTVPANRGVDAEMTLLGWASRTADPKRRTVRMPQQPLEPLIAAFARVDSPNDPIVPRSYVADAAIAEPAKAVDDAQLHAAAVRFRDALLRLEGKQGSPDEPESRDRWGRFRAAVNVVTPGDLRYSHSLQTVTSLRPSNASTRTPGGRGRAASDEDLAAFGEDRLQRRHRVHRGREAGDRRGLQDDLTQLVGIDAGFQRGTQVLRDL